MFLNSLLQQRKLDMLSAMHWALAKLISPLWRRVEDEAFPSQGKT